MENMILTAFPRLKEIGMWTKYRVNKKHERKCYVTNATHLTGGQTHRPD